MPKGVSANDAAMVEPLAVAVHSVKKVPIAGEDVLVIWGGTIGILVARCKAI